MAKTDMKSLETLLMENILKSLQLERKLSRAQFSEQGQGAKGEEFSRVEETQDSSFSLLQLAQKARK